MRCCTLVLHLIFCHWSLVEGRQMRLAFALEQKRSCPWTKKMLQFTCNIPFPSADRGQSSNIHGRPMTPVHRIGDGGHFGRIPDDPYKGGTIPERFHHIRPGTLSQGADHRIPGHQHLGSGRIRAQDAFPGHFHSLVSRMDRGGFVLRIPYDGRGLGEARPGAVTASLGQ